MKATPQVVVGSILLLGFAVAWISKSASIQTTEPFALTLASLSSSEKAQWKERIQAVAKQTLLRGFIGMNAEKTAIYSMFDTSRGKEIFQNIWTGPLTGEAAKYFVEKLWATTTDWEASFLYGEGPMTYTAIDQYIRTHPMFSGDEWEKTLDKSLDSLSYLNYYYQLSIQMERKLSQVIPSNPIVGGQWRQRARYMLCALQQSTTYDTFTAALTALGFSQDFFIYTRNPFLYRRLKSIYDSYRGADALTRIENQLFIYFQWEVLVGEFESGTYGNMTASLDKLASQCAGVSLNVPTGSSGSTGSAGSSGSTGSTGSAGSTGTTGTGRTQIVYATPPELNAWAIQSPPITLPPRPNIQTPTITPAPPSDAVPFKDPNTDAEQKRFKIVMGIFIGVVLLLWVIIVFMLLAPSSVPAPVPPVPATVY